jgi:3-hydroxyanthranilate 3,4-dioxygenase
VDDQDRSDRSEPAAPIDVAGWIDGHSEALGEGRAGPLLDGELRVLVVAGRGPRRDYHVNTVAELFYQLHGDVSVLVGEPGNVREVTIRTGELWLAPAGVPHSPQRPAGTTGLVIERPREPGTTESFRWYCERCGTVVNDIVMERVDPVSLRQAMTKFYADEAARTCPTCSELVRPPGG